MVIAVIVCGSVVYVEQYYRADVAAEEALVSDGNVSVERTGYGWYFDGPGEESALVFYPGGKVEETAYAPSRCRFDSPFWESGRRMKP